MTASLTAEDLLWLLFSAPVLYQLLFAFWRLVKRDFRMPTDAEREQQWNDRGGW